MRSWTKAAVMIIPAAFVFSTSAARASDAEDFSPPAVIERRAYLPHHEFRVALAYLPQDPFYKAAGPDLAYTWHINEYVSWEVIRGAYFTTWRTDIRNALKREFDASKDPYEKASYIAASSVQFTPFYGRYSFMNRGVVHQETYVTAGLAANGWTKPEDGKSGGGVRPGFTGGLGFRWYTSRRTSLKLEVLENLFMRVDGSVGDQVWITVGGAFAIPR